MPTAGPWLTSIPADAPEHSVWEVQWCTAGPAAAFIFAPKQPQLIPALIFAANRRRPTVRARFRRLTPEPVASPRIYTTEEFLSEHCDTLWPFWMVQNIEGAEVLHAPEVYDLGEGSLLYPVTMDSGVPLSIHVPEHPSQWHRISISLESP